VINRVILTEIISILIILILNNNYNYSFIIIDNFIQTYIHISLLHINKICEAYIK